MSTAVAPLRRWVPLLNLDQGSPIPRCLVLKLAGKLTPTHIANTLSQGVVLEHVLDLQTLDADRLVLTNNASRELVLIVPSPVSNLSMDTSYFETGFRYVLTALLLLSKATLSLSQFLLVLTEVPWIDDMLPIGSDNHTLQAKIKPHLLLHDRQVLDILFDQDGDEVAVSSVLGNGNCRGIASFGKWATPHNIQRCIHPGERESSSIPLEGGTYVSNGLLPMPAMNLG